MDIKEATPVPDLNPDQGWIGMSVQFPVDAGSGGSELFVLERARFPVGQPWHQWHRHPNVEEFACLVKGDGVILDGNNEIPVTVGDMTFHKKGERHGFRNTSVTEEAEMIWGSAGAASKAEAGYELRYPERVADLHAH